MSHSDLMAKLKLRMRPLIRVPGIIRAWVYLAGCKRGKRVRILGRGSLRVVGAQNISLGDWVWFNEGPLCTELVCGPEGSITVGTSSAFNYGVSLQAKTSIRIGNHCMFGAMVMVRDANGAHQAPVVIGDRVWLAHRAIIEPGVTIGDDAVISAGSVVMDDVPPRMLAVGNPARCLPIVALRRPIDPAAAEIRPLRPSP